MVLVLAENNMIKFEDIKVGAVVRKKGYKETTYTITDVNCKSIINNHSCHCISYVPNDNDCNYTRFVIDIDTFMFIFDLVE